MAQIINIFDINFIELLFRLKLISAVLSFLFMGLAVYFIIQFQKLVGIKAQITQLSLRAKEPASGGGLQSKWEEILRHLDSDREAEWKFAIIEADKLIDDLLKSAGYSGETMGDRLIGMEKGQLESLDGLWEAHKVRNNLVHDVNYFLRYAEARRVVQLYERVLQELGGI